MTMIPLIPRYDRLLEGVEEYLAEVAECEQQAREKLQALVDAVTEAKRHNQTVRESDRMITDGFGSAWTKCDLLDCGLHVVRPGRSDCYHPLCPDGGDQ